VNAGFTSPDRLAVPASIGQLLVKEPLDCGRAAPTRSASTCHLMYGSPCRSHVRTDADRQGPHRRHLSRGWLQEL